MNMEQLNSILEAIAVAIDLVGISILVFAALKFIAQFLIFEFKRFRGLECAVEIRSLRLGLGSYILLSLEFTIISDVIHTSVSRSMDDLLALDEALEKLAAEDPRKAKLVELRYFSGLTNEQAAKALGVSVATAERDWTFARAWLRREMMGEAPASN